MFSVSSLNSFGRLFHNVGPETAKLRPPNPTLLVRGTFSLPWAADRLRRSDSTAATGVSDVNKDLGFKAKAKAKDLGFKAKTKAKDLSFKAKAKDLRFKAKAKAKDLTQVLESRPRTWGGKDQGPRPRTHHRVEKC